MQENPAHYFKTFREKIGFSNQGNAKKFLGAKDISPNIDLTYIQSLNLRIKQIIIKINNIADVSYKRDDIDALVQTAIFHPYQIIRDANLIPRLNNQGRRPEEVLFSWLRGFAITEFFTPAFAKIFAVNISNITQIGDDDLQHIDTFKRSPKADLEIIKNGNPIRIEVQSGFQGINDIKEHKVREAIRVFNDRKIQTVAIHIDLFNGQVAFVPLNNIGRQDPNWITRQQMEGQSVLTIDQNFFKWRLLDPLPSYNALELGYKD
ncbi:MAG: hypothetical protein R8J85_01245 [Mariprofundales bacterium]